MARGPRVDFPGARHHVMNRGARRAAVFSDDATARLFLKHLAALPERRGVVVHAFAIMPNHFHLLLETPRGNLSEAMQTLQAGFCQDLNRAHKWDGPVFKGRFKNRLVCDDSYWMHLLAYLHLNPVRAGLAEQVGDGKWTSHRAYIGAEPQPSWLHTAELLQLHGGPSGYSRYLAGLSSGTSLEPTCFEADSLWSPSDTEVQPAQRIRAEAPRAAGFAGAIAQVAFVTGMSAQAIQQSGRAPRGNPARWVLAWWMLRHDYVPAKEAAASLGITMSTLLNLARKARSRRTSSAQLGSWMHQLESLDAGS